MNNNDYLKICQFARLISRAECTKWEISIEYVPHVDNLKVDVYPEGMGSNRIEVFVVNLSNSEKVKAMAKYLNNLYLKLVVNEPSKTN